MAEIKMDLNSYCIGHTTGSGDNDRLLALPEGFVTEAQALGAGVKKTANGFLTPEYLYKTPDMLKDIVRIDEQSAVKIILEKIKNAPKDVLLKVSGPYSVLASVIDPSLLYRWLRKEPDLIHEALEKITRGLSGYIQAAFSLGAKILSLADPYANEKILGQNRYREYAAAYFVKLLAQILRENTRGVIHLCPHHSLLLEEYGYIKKETINFETESYTEALRIYSAKNKMLLAGHQCIYSGKVQTLHLLTLMGT
ncbi:MAG: hypothetical protein LBQ57_05090 [Spirochaetales bacterium]|jgi:uroporphyrinogen-III decarboxylase|nr:hypothetical protein [Spirochaetales bacterium]